MERERRAPKARESRRRGGGRGAAGAEVDRGADGGEVWGGVSPSPPGEGVSPSHRGRGCAPSPRKFFYFGSQYGEFWGILDGIFFTVQLPVLHAKPEINRYMRIKAVMVSK